MKKILTSLILTLTAMSIFGQSAEPSFSANSVRPNGIFNYILTLKDTSGDIQKMSIPLPNGMQIVSQNFSKNFSIVNFKASSSITLTLGVNAPSEEGTYTIPEWELKVGKDTIKVKSLSFKVDKNAQEADNDPFENAFSTGAFARQRSSQQRMQETRRQQTQSFEASLKNNTRLEVKIARDKIFIGEAVPCELIFSFDKSLQSRGLSLAGLRPQIKNADAFDCPPLPEKPIIDANSNPDKILIKYSTVITPIKVGEYDLDFSAEGVFQREISAEDMMEMSLAERMMYMGSARQFPFEVNMPAQKIIVSELPAEGKPKNFTGAIGKFSLENVSLEPDALTVGEPCMIYAKVIGMGNFARISAPELVSDDNWKTYKPKSTFADESNGFSNIGVKTFEYTAVPTKPDLKSAPIVSFNYFDPVTQKYVLINSKEIPVSVAPSGRSKRVEEKESESKEPALVEIIETKNSASQYHLLESPYFWISQFAILAAIVGFISIRRKKLRLLNDPEYAKSLNYKKLSTSKLKEANKAAKASDLKKFFDASRSTIQYILSSKTQHDAAALLMREAKDIMKNIGCSDEKISDISIFFEGADAMAFGGLDTSKINLKELDAKLVQIFSEISNKI